MWDIFYRGTFFNGIFSPKLIIYRFRFRPVSDNRASLLRSSTPAKKPLTENQRDSFVNLWKNQIKLAMRLIPLVVPTVPIRCASPDLSLR